jgi:hypothetical protein
MNDIIELKELLAISRERELTDSESETLIHLMGTEKYSYQTT